MRKYIGKYILLFVICLAIGLSAYLFITVTNDRSTGQRNTLMNRTANELSSKDAADIENELTALVSSNNWEEEYGRSNVPTDVRFIRADSGNGSYSQLWDGDSIWSISQDGEIKGFLVFSFRDDHVIRSVVISEVIVGICFLISALFFIYIDRKVIILLTGFLIILSASRKTRMPMLFPNRKTGISASISGA